MPESPATHAARWNRPSHRERPRPRFGLLPLTLTTLSLVACGIDTEPSGSGPDVVVDTIGDTTVVRTQSGSVWGAEATLVPEVAIGRLDGPEEYLFGRVTSIAVDDFRRVYVLDDQAQHVRVYDSEGVYLETLGGRGEGPGEFTRAESMAVLPDGRLVVRDPGNLRVQVFGPGAGDRNEWPYLSGNFYTPRALYTDVRGRTFLFSRIRDSSGDLVMHIVVLGPDGAPVDTLPEPSSDFEPSRVRAEDTDEEGNTSSVSSVVPFSPFFRWSVHPSGHFLTGLSSEYRIDLVRDDGVLRIERQSTPIPVSDAERDHELESTVRMIRLSVPGWNWNGPSIPRDKPVFKGLLSGRDGRIWVWLSTEAYSVENDNYNPDNPFSEQVSWIEPTRYDVFESDGTYLGVVATPDEFSTYPDPVFEGDHVWAVTRDELGVQRVVRYRIVVGESE